MEQHPSNYPGVVDQKEVDSLKDILKELNIEETNSPAAPSKPQRFTSFGGRVRIDILTSEGAEKWIGKVINVGGWVKSLRQGGGGEFCFIDLNDGSTIKNLQREKFNNITKVEIYAWISRFFIDKLLIPILNNPSINALINDLAPSLP